MYRLAHISDIHLGPLPDITFKQLCSKRLTGYLNWRLNRKWAMQDGSLDLLITHLKTADVDHIAISGDLVNLALPEEFNRMKDWLAALGDANDVSLILGNHDTYVHGAKETAIESWKPYLTGDSGPQSPAFPYRRDREKVAILGVNSGEATLPFFATGYFKQDQADRLAKMLDDAKADEKFRVVMIHHPPNKNGAPWAKRLIGDDLFRDVIKAHGAELVLHGHNHLNSMNWIDGTEGPVSVIGIAAAGKAPQPDGIDDKSHPAGRYNIYEIDGKAGNWSCTLQAFGYANGETEISHLETRDCLTV